MAATLAYPRYCMGIVPYTRLRVAQNQQDFYAESPLLQAYLADTASPAMRDAAFGLYFSLAFGVGLIWSAILGWEIDRFGFGAAFWTMALSFLASGGLLVLIRDKKVEHPKNVELR